MISEEGETVTMRELPTQLLSFPAAAAAALHWFAYLFSLRLRMLREHLAYPASLDVLP